MQKTAQGSLYHRRDRGIMDITKKPVIIAITGFFGAADQIRTGDLILTKDALYRLSYSSKDYAPHYKGHSGDREGT